tara:strand:- start:2409 stop:2624 length:216 start_codon:yes stop_codon:yes gene_type:complete
MTKIQIIDELKNIKEQFLNAEEGVITSDDLIEAIDDIVLECEGNDGMDFDFTPDDEYYEGFENLDFTQLKV